VSRSCCKARQPVQAHVTCTPHLLGYHFMAKYLLGSPADCSRTGPVCCPSVHRNHPSLFLPGSAVQVILAVVSEYALPGAKHTCLVVPPQGARASRIKKSADMLLLRPAERSQAYSGRHSGLKGPDSRHCNRFPFAGKHYPQPQQWVCLAQRTCARCYYSQDLLLDNIFVYSQTFYELHSRNRT
jgi:hypothetical protein